jgi:hypothetical protein
MKDEQAKPITFNPNELVSAEIEELKSSIKYFFVNNLLDESKHHLWELFKWWAKDNEAATRQDIIDMMLYYDACRTVLEKVYILFFVINQRKTKK